MSWFSLLTLCNVLKVPPGRPDSWVVLVRRITMPIVRFIVLRSL